MVIMATLNRSLIIACLDGALQPVVEIGLTLTC
jgi:hypothetical protein